jgi:membrane protease YdiL (CAAX protease family)
MNDTVFEEVPNNRILLFGILVEGVLAGVFYVWQLFRDFEDQLFPSLMQLQRGLLHALVLCIANLLLLHWAAPRIKAMEKTLLFVDTVVYPLAKTMGPAAALLISLCAGIGEELFFRGVLQTEFGLLIASLLFSLLHFGAAVREFPFVAVWYAIIGGYIGWVYVIEGSIWVPILMHAIYDFAALLYFRFLYRPRVNVIA